MTNAPAGLENFYPEEKPVLEATVDGFWMDRDAVTNEQFARFVDATGYVTNRQPQFRIARRVVKGGSHLCAPNYCFRYRPAARPADDRNRHEPLN